MHTRDMVKVMMDFVIYDYTVLRNDRKTRNGGGLATFVSYNLINRGREQQSIVIKVWTGKDILGIIN